MIQEANDILDSGLTRQQTEIALKKARMAYDISNKKNRPAGKNYYACLIYKLEHELGMHTKTLREVKMLALEYYRKNPELFKQEDEEVLKIMIERDYTCDKPITAAQDDNTNFVDYAETKLGFKIKYPSDWKVNGSDILNQYQVTFTPPGKGVYVTVGIDNFTSEEIALNASGNYIPSYVSPSMRCLEADSKHYYLSSYPAVRLIEIQSYGGPGQPTSPNMEPHDVKIM